MGYIICLSLCVLALALTIIMIARSHVDEQANAAENYLIQTAQFRAESGLIEILEKVSRQKDTALTVAVDDFEADGVRHLSVTVCPCVGTENHHDYTFSYGRTGNAEMFCRQNHNKSYGSVGIGWRANRMRRIPTKTESDLAFV